MKIKRIDYCILILALGLCVFSFYMISSQKGQATQLVFESPEAVWKYPLEKDRIIKVQGSLGESIIEIQDKSFLWIPLAQIKPVFFHQPSKKADWSACLPNRIFIRIDGSDESGLDAISF